MKRNSVMPHSFRVLGCNKISPHLQSSNSFLFILFSFSQTEKLGWYKKIKCTSKVEDRHSLNYHLEILAEVCCRTRVCHCLSKGNWFSQQLLDSEEADEDILLLNRKNIQVKLAYSVKRKVMEISLLQHFQWPSLQAGKKAGSECMERGAGKPRAAPEPAWDPWTETWPQPLSPLSGKALSAATELGKNGKL